MKKELKRLLKQYYIIKTEYSEALMEYETAKRVVRYWFPFDNQTKDIKEAVLSKYSPTTLCSWIEVRKVANNYNYGIHERYERNRDYKDIKKDIDKQRTDSQKKCIECKKRVKELNGQLQVVCEMIDNRILSDKLKERYKQLRSKQCCLKS